MSELLFDGLHRGIGKVLDLRLSQHSLTASNLANADTPGYKAKFIPFDEILSEVVYAEEGQSLRRTDLRHSSGLGTNPEAPQVSEIEPVPWSADGNSVVQEREAVRLKENATLFTGVSKGLSRRLALLRFAASNGERG